MKAIYKALVAALAATPLLTGCIEESFPTNGFTGTQIEGTDEGTDAFCDAIPSHMNVIGTVSTDQHYDFGMPSLMHARDCMTEDLAVRYAGGYDWFASYARNSTALGPGYMVCQFTWNFYYEQILCCNNALKMLPADSEDPVILGKRAIVLASRAATYLDAARCYEFLPCDINEEGLSAEGNDIIGLSMPIVTEETSEETLNNNPRATHEQMLAFILGDLNEALTLFDATKQPRTSKTKPDVNVTKGLLARAYLWDASYQAEINADNAKATESYNHAATYAREAITGSGATPLTEAQWLSKTAGFNDINVSSWMWGGQYVAEDDAVVAGGIRTWTSFCSNEQNFGYAAPAQGAFTEIGVSLYNKINDADWRKLSWVAPEGTANYGKAPYLDQAFGEANLSEPYISLKFRPGQGNMDDPLVGAVVGYPLMRVEEMYFIEAEAKAHVDMTAGKALLENFMKTYRYPTYSALVTGQDALIQEIILQKRIELWGEGQTMFDVKRLNMSVTRFYNGTNFIAGASTINTKGRPGWMNLCIVQQEVSNNTAIEGYNTPTSAGLYDLHASSEE